MTICHVTKTKCHVRSEKYPERIKAACQEHLPGKIRPTWENAEVTERHATG